MSLEAADEKGSSMGMTGEQAKRRREKDKIALLISLMETCLASDAEMVSFRISRKKVQFFDSSIRESDEMPVRLRSMRSESRW
ncbi:MAG TPA: hypothetical protein VJQ25_00005, partial [Nitrospira sp.]|nr:hypothetical protein [Nitrospira sp.]